jgi:signal peptidase I
MTKAGTADGGISDLTMSPHGQDARATSRDSLGCELAAEVLRSTGRLRLQAIGGSMLPVVWPGDILSVRSHDVGAARPGDIVVFRRDGRLVTHRLVERTIRQDRIQWITRGDRMRHNDAPVSELLGRVTAITRDSRRLTPHQSMTGRLAAWILSRSDLATQVLFTVRNLGFGTRDSGFGKGNEIPPP